MSSEYKNNVLELETDIVIVGYGGAGAAAAIAAHDNGAQVTILEKMPSGGGSTFLGACLSNGRLAII
jgi:succinate dehydrogenase/fumarate reductase flavoprotein subunit